VAQPIADQRAARRWTTLAPGSGFRSDRHAPPLPRTHHLELLAGGVAAERLYELAAGGLLISELDAGGLDPASGRVWLEVPGARRIRDGAPAEPVGRLRLRGRVGELLGGVVGIGAARESAGAGWCAKGGQRKPVWATLPALVLVGLEVVP
jgi:predicted Zn-dependent protease